jgi:hypothetical protein
LDEVVARVEARLGTGALDSTSAPPRRSRRSSLSPEAVAVLNAAQRQTTARHLLLGLCQVNWDRTMALVLKLAMAVIETSALHNVHYRRIGERRGRGACVPVVPSRGRCRISSCRRLKTLSVRRAEPTRWMRRDSCVPSHSARARRMPPQGADLVSRQGAMGRSLIEDALDDVCVPRVWRTGTGSNAKPVIARTAAGLCRPRSARTRRGRAVACTHGPVASVPLARGA